MVSDAVTVGTVLDSQSRTAAAQTGLAEDFSQFLNLLTVQLQNQDPLDPMDTAEFTSQLVAFTGVEQQINANQKLDNLISLNLSSSMGSSLGYVGMDISYVSSEFNYQPGTGSELTYALSGNAVEAKIRVLDEGGDVVFEADAEKSAGSHTFTWDGTLDGGGTAEAGTYEVRIDALDIDDNPVTATTVVKGRVDGIETQNGLLFAIVGERAVSLGNILNASVPEEAPEPEPEA